MERESLKRDIAVIGLSCIFHQSENPTQFWENLKSGKELIQFYKDSDLEKMGVDPSVYENPGYIKTKTFIENTDQFDYPFFDYPFSDANTMDPQTRILHQQVWAALEDAGYNPASYHDKIGLYLTAADNFNWVIHSTLNKPDEVDPFFLQQINNKSFASTLISYKLGMKGPSMVVDTACSSSLTTIHLASKSLLLRECSIAIAGGMELKTVLEEGYEYQDGMIMSKDGHCKTFDKDSTGTVPNEGGAIVVLKRLEDAIRDKDHIYAVIRSSAANNDGKDKVGYTAPSVSGQANCISTALRMAKVPYDSITYIEAHGTGTKLGDPIEIEALNKAFEYDTAHKCAIGSVKSNIGHLGNAAGITGFLKTVLSLKYKMIPPSLHYNAPNPEINFKGGPFFVNDQLTEWKRVNNIPLRAGVSSFGIGGTNVHVVVEEYEDIKVPSSSRPYHLIVSSSKSKSSLENFRIKLKDFSSTEKFQCADLAYTMKVGRVGLPYRNFIVCKDQEDLVSKLSVPFAEPVYTKPVSKKLVFMFPGQGTQYYKMGQELYKVEKDFRNIIDKGFEILHAITGTDYKAIVGYSEPDVTSDPELVNSTKYTQPLLFLFEYAMASMLIKWGIKPNMMIGHSIGEYAAACIAGVFSFEEALELIVLRADLMNETEKGSMVAISISDPELLNIIPSALSIAAINSETSYVVSGNSDEIDNLIAILEEKGISYVKLKTSHAFHSSLMDDILEKYESKLRLMQLTPPVIPFISNLSGKEILSSEAVDPMYWVKHLRNTVHFKEGIDYLLNKEKYVFVEMGPGKVLNGLCKQSKYYSEHHAVIDLVRIATHTVNDNEKLTHALGELWSQGIDIDWKAYYTDETRYRISAPTYSFDHYQMDLKVDPFKKLSVHHAQNSNWLYQSNWKKSMLNKSNFEAGKNYLIFTDGRKLITSVINALKKEGNNVIEIRKGDRYNKINESLYELNPKDYKDVDSIFQELGEVEFSNCNIIFNWDFAVHDQQNLLIVFNLLNQISKNAISLSENSRLKITVLGDLQSGVLENEERNVIMTASMKQLYVLSQENINIFSSSIDADQEIDHEGTIQNVIDDLKYNNSDTIVAYRLGTRWTEFYENIPVGNQPVANPYIGLNKTYLILGGNGHIGKVLKEHLRERYHAKIIVFGRKEMPDFKETDCYYYPADISDYNSLLKQVLEVEKEHGKINGVIHVAGNLSPDIFKSIEHLNEKAAALHFDPKVNGIIHLHSIFKERSLDFLWVASSLSSILGGFTFGAYAVANAFMDSFIAKNKTPKDHWFCINLDGITQDRISDEKLVKFFEQSFTLNHSQIIIAKDDPNTVSVKHLQNDQNETQVQNNKILLDRVKITNEYIAPQTETEIKISEIIQDFFGYDSIGIEDNFFEIGADSLKVMTLLRRINKLMNVELEIQEIYNYPSIKELSKMIDIVAKLHKVNNTNSGENTILI